MTRIDIAVKTHILPTFVLLLWRVSTGAAQAATYEWGCPTVVAVSATGDMPDHLAIYEKIIHQLGEKLIEANSVASWGIIFVTIALIVATIIPFVQSLMINRRIEKELETLDSKIDTAIRIATYRRLDSEVKELVAYAHGELQKILQNDLSRPLEQRYLLVQYLRNGIWGKLQKPLLSDLENHNYVGILERVRFILSTDTALRQMLSSNPGDVYTGTARLLDLVNKHRESIPTNLLWRFVCLLSQQQRFRTSASLAMASKLCEALGKRLFDCQKVSFAEDVEEDHQSC